MANDRQQQRYERFAELRTAYPTADYEEIMARIHDEEVEADEAAEGRRILETVERCSANAAWRDEAATPIWRPDTND